MNSVFVMRTELYCVCMSVTIMMVLSYGMVSFMGIFVIKNNHPGLTIYCVVCSVRKHTQT